MAYEFSITAGIDPAQAAHLKERAFAYSSLAPRAADILRAPGVRLEYGAYSAYRGRDLVGAVSLWPIMVSAGQQVFDLTLLGPLMVDPGMQGCGIGKALMTAALEAADANHAAPVMLIGDEGYYAQFGFSSRPTQGWALSGVFARERLLLRAHGATLPETGDVSAALAPPAREQSAA